MSSDNPALRETTHERVMENVINHELGYFECEPFETCTCGWNANGNEKITFEAHVAALRETRPARGNGGAVIHKKPEFDSVPTPDWFYGLFEGFHDPYPLGCAEPVEPPANAKIFVNPGYSRKEVAAEKCIEWHQKGHRVVMLVPMETSTQFAKRLIQYGVERMFFDRRVFPNCRGVELLVLTGDRNGR